MSHVQAVDRALLLLSEIGRESGGLVDLASRVDLATSTAARLLNTLESAGAVRRSDDASYEIGPLIQSLTAAPEGSQRLEQLVHPHLVELSTQLDEAACLALISGDETVTVDQVDAPKPVQAENWTGTRVPLHAGGAGLVAMATWDDVEVERYLSGELVACSALTVTDPAKHRCRLEEIRRTGVCWTHGEYVEGLSSLSAAIQDVSGRAVAVLYTYGPSYRYPAPGSAEKVARTVWARAERISIQLGWTGSLTPVRNEAS